MNKYLDKIPKALWAAVIAVLSATSCKLKYDKDGLSVEVEKTKLAMEQAQQEVLAVKEQNIVLARSQEALSEAMVVAAKQQSAVLAMPAQPLEPLPTVTARPRPVFAVPAQPPEQPKAGSDMPR